MRIRRLWIVLGIVLVPAAAFADDHKAFFGGLSLVNDSTLTGFRLGFTGKPRPGNLSLEGDFSAQRGTHEGLKLWRTTVMGGIRLTFPYDVRASRRPDQQATQGQPAHPRQIFSVYALVGAARDSEPDEAGWNAAFAVGVSYDVVVVRSRSGGGLGVRAQTDFIARNDGSDFPRISAGLVYFFGR
jgi:hypothetical protein